MNAPSFSPAMLQLFLYARCVAAHARMPRLKFQTAAEREKARLRKLARITANQMHSAWMGRLPEPQPRARLWAVLGHFPSDFGVVLTHGGQEHG
ncbi:MAG: hypothetical protein EOR68_08425 [Mesorhizobium sp.]|uniref:hypothetical protein n=1 Tax=Mesorhizobium sp. TaxID=1871066 RepID=UPI000FE89D11|nr:hypothetical protein [Mesorhizobium sp.]RWM02122.1 MAG: hypothetical protein EOR68_08425 [Mesorhizobium sp.]